MKPIEFVYIPKEIYYKKLTHSIMEADKSKFVVWAGGVRPRIVSGEFLSKSKGYLLENFFSFLEEG